MAPKVTIKERVFNNPMLPADRGTICVMVGLATKGPIETPVLVSSIQSFESVFGPPNPKSFLAFAARKFLKYSPNLFVTRIADSFSVKEASVEIFCKKKHWRTRRTEIACENLCFLQGNMGK